jgi:hypothetical protein
MACKISASIQCRLLAGAAERLMREHYLLLAHANGSRGAAHGQSIPAHVAVGTFNIDPQL